MKEDQNCCTCLFFDEDKSECHKSPPFYINEEKSFWPYIFNDENCWCGEWREKEGGPEDHVKLAIFDNKTGKVTYSDPRVCIAPKPGQITVWKLRTDFELSNDFSIRVDWPAKK